MFHVQLAENISNSFSRKHPEFVHKLIFCTSSDESRIEKAITARKMPMPNQLSFPTEENL